jgi:hypothetical protein
MDKVELEYYRQNLIHTKKVRQELIKRDKLGKLPPRWFMKEMMDDSKLVEEKK